MRKFWMVLAMLVILPLAARAQETPRVEMFGGYSNLSADLSGTNFNMSGVGVSATENLNSWFGGVLDFSTHYGKENGISTNLQTLTYGPVFTYRKNSRLHPFGHGMVGAARGGADYLNISRPEYRIALIGGGGLDVVVSPRLALRLIQADYLMTTFNSDHQNNLRLSAGFVFSFGKTSK